MAHLASAFSSYQTFLNGADAYWSVDLAAMNNSGVTGNVILATNTEDDGTRYLNVSVFAEGLTPDVQHAQHIAAWPHHVSLRSPEQRTFEKGLAHTMQP